MREERKCAYRHCDELIQFAENGNRGYCAPDPDEKNKQSCKAKEEVYKKKERQEEKAETEKCKIELRLTLQHLLQEGGSEVITFEVFDAKVSQYINYFSERKVIVDGQEPVIREFEGFQMCKCVIDDEYYVKIEKMNYE